MTTMIITRILWIKNELKSTSISSPYIEENDNQYITNNELYINDNIQINKNSSNKNDINEMDNKRVAIILNSIKE